MRSLLVSSASHSARSALRTKVSFDSSSVPFVSCSSCLCFLRDLLWSISQSSCSLHGQGPHELAYLSLALVPFILSVDWKALPLHNQPPLAVHSCYEALAVNERRYEENHEPLRNTLVSDASGWEEALIFESGGNAASAAFAEAREDRFIRVVSSIRFCRVDSRGGCHLYKKKCHLHEKKRKRSQMLHMPLLA
ncbi:hypothetical protein TIFTF001_054122 [Ficus carica]|uniref:Uncharacterized protein n=1 Tax=Ficus carica TaxID=3494 RepID=A0AA88EHY0_FICCA|nr:hypothetical protein TIFTF001_054122 [Ficus carica]